MRKIRLIWTFYQYFLLISFAISLCCGSIFWKYGISTFFFLFWFKAATLAITYYFVEMDKSKEFYYFLNSGFSKVFLWTTTVSFDFLLFIFLLTQIYLIG